MHKLDEITSLLSSLGQWCAAHKLEERDLPPSLREIFQRMRTYAAHVPDPSYCRLMHFIQVN
jgi:hypothetical protein